MAIAQGALQVTPRGEAPGPHLPVDDFLRALARAQQAQAIAVVFSGTGSDGTLGLREVKAVYGITDFRVAVSNITQTTLRAIIGDMDLDSALSSRDTIKARLKASISDDVSDWGLTVKSVEIQDIKPSLTMQASMEKQAAAERERKAAVTRAEGEKQAAILQAEARLESARRDAEAQVTLADGTAEAIRKVTAAISDRELPAYYLLGEKYITAIHDLAGSPGGKTVFLPGDLLQSLQALVGRGRSG